MSTQSEERLTYRAPEVAALLGISTGLVWRLLWEQKIRSVKVGRARVIPRAAIQEYLESLSRNASAV